MTEPMRVGKYEIIEEIGRGGFAVVYRARDTKMDRQVALKVIAGGVAHEQAFSRRFLQEARTAANLCHPNIVLVYDSGDADGVLYLAMALIGEGRTLRDLLAEQVPLSLEFALHILTPLARALDYLHGREPPLVHCDVKPANILLRGETDAPWVVLTDFGIVRSMEASAELSERGTILGSPAYMAPEQVDSEQWGEISPLTDVYALGVIAYQMFTGRLPFEGEIPKILHAHAYKAPPSPRKFAPQLEEGVTQVLLRALAKLPAERYASAGALVDALRYEYERVQAEQEEKRRQERIASLLERGGQAMRGRDWDRAITLYRSVLRIDGENQAALWALARARRAKERVGRREWRPSDLRRWFLVGSSVVVGVVLLGLLSLGWGGGRGLVSPFFWAGNPTSTPTSTPTPTLDPTRMPTATPIPTRTPVPDVTSTPTPVLPEAVVLAGGAGLRPGATTWWRVRETLPAGTELELVGYDPDYADWVYVRTPDGASRGWVEVAKLEINRPLTGLPVMTPIPTLTSTPASTPTPTCEDMGDPLQLDAWVVGKRCLSGGWIATMFVQGHGGDCAYTYAWEREVRGGPMAGSMTFEVTAAGFGQPIVGEASVTSAGETVTAGVLVSPPDCGQ